MGLKAKSRRRTRYEEKLLVLHKHALQLSSATGLEQIVTFTLDAMEVALGFDFADILFVEEGCLRIKGSRGMEATFLELPLDGRGVVVKAARKKATIRISDTKGEPEYVERLGFDWKKKPTMLSELAVPVILDGETAAVLNVESKRLNAFTQEDQKLLETLASHVASAVSWLQSQKSLRSSQAKTRGILDALPDLVFEVNSDGVFTDYHAATPSDFAYPPEKFLRKSVRSTLPPELASRLEAAMVTAKKTGISQNVEYQLPKLSGEMSDWEARIASTSTGNFLIVARNITERKRAEEAYRAVVQHALQGLAILQDSRIVFTNQALLEMSGYNVEETLSLPPNNLIATVHPEDRERVMTGMQDILAGKPVSSPQAFRLRRKDGTIRWVETLASRIEYQGKPAIQVAYEDITDRKQMEEALRRRCDELAALQETVLDITRVRYGSPSLLEAIVDRAVRLLHAQGGGLDLCDPVKREVRCVVSCNTPHDFRGLVLKYGEGASGKVAETGTPLIIDNYRKWEGDTRVPGAADLGAVLSAPMIWQGQVTGVIQVIETGATRHFTQSDLDMLTLFANHAAIAVENARLLEQEQQHAVQLEGIVEERTRKLATSEKRFRDFADLLPQIAFETDMKGNFTFVNRAASSSTGYTHEDMTRGLNALQVVVPKEQGTARKNISRALSGEKLPPHEYTVRRKDGSTFPVMMDSAPLIREDKIVGMRTVAIDITERKRMEEDLRASRARLEYVVTSNPAAIYSGKPLANHSDWYLTYISERVVTMLGYEPQKFIGHPEFWESHVHPTDLVPTLAAIPQFFKEEQHTFDYRFLHKDGTYRWIREEAKLVCDNEGRPIEVNGYWTEITELKRLERQLAESERLAAIGETAAMVGHDLRNPLQAISAATYVLKENLPPAASEQTKEMLEAIESSVAYSDRIVNDLLEYSQDLRLQLSETTPRSLARDALLQVKIPRNVTVADLTSDDPAIQVDAVKIRRIFVNLIENAIDATPTGGEFTVSNRMSNDQLEVKFTDTGKGIPENLLPELWKPLVTTKPKGIGLGLAICKRIAEAHGGSLSVNSTVGKGTTFTLRLPIMPVKKEPSGHE